MYDFENLEIDSILIGSLQTIYVAEAFLRHPLISNNLPRLHDRQWTIDTTLKSIPINQYLIKTLIINVRDGGHLKYCDRE